MPLPDNWEACLSRMEVDIQMIRDHFHSDPYIATSALADLEIGAEQMSKHYIELKSAAAEDLPRPDPRSILAYMHACYVTAGVNLSHWEYRNG